MDKAYLVLADGTIFEGSAFGAEIEAVGEAVFTTAVVGYAETLSNPCYAGQIVVQTFPLAGNYGIIEEDLSGNCAAAGFVVREWCDAPSNFRSQYDLDSYLRQQNIPGICGAAAALEEICGKMEENTAKLTAMRDKLIEGIMQIPHTVLNGDAKRRLPNNVNVCFEGIEGESMLLWLDAKGIAASSGSACTSGSLDPSHVLLALGRPHEIAHGSLRLSLSDYNTMEEMDYILETLPGVIQYLRNMSPVWDALESGKMPHII